MHRDRRRHLCRVRSLILEQLAKEMPASRPLSPNIGLRQCSSQPDIASCELSDIDSIYRLPINNRIGPNGSIYSCSHQDLSDIGLSEQHSFIQSDVGSVVAPSPDSQSMQGYHGDIPVIFVEDQDSMEKHDT